MATVLEAPTKFWSVEVKGTQAFVRFGKLGAKGTTQLKVCGVGGGGTPGGGKAHIAV